MYVQMTHSSKLNNQQVCEKSKIQSIFICLKVKQYKENITHLEHPSLWFLWKSENTKAAVSIIMRLHKFFCNKKNKKKKGAFSDTDMCASGRGNS